MEIRNQQGERLDTAVEGDGPITIVFAHGLGTNKDEGTNLFVDISKALPEYRRVRFSFSGYGESEGRQEEGSYFKFARDLGSVLQAVREAYGERIYLIAHSRGTTTTALLSPDGIERTVFTSMPDTDAEPAIRRLQERIRSRGGVPDEHGITDYPRIDGNVQRIGPEFWTSLRAYDEHHLKAYAAKTDLLIVRALQDEIIAPYDIGRYQLSSTQYCEIPGNHNYSDPAVRERLIGVIRNFFLR